ncbi:MerR family transcriptional regulator [Micromonospora sp. URMC 106]|uniref:MerR family transcriptional regulator n=1 Tax=Micromonospora sp. URMC 106 TaxID=3423408 RepID=UPI003F1D99D9
MRIGDLARETGVNPRLLRYYEEQGLLASHRAAGGHRRYAEDAVTTVRHIRALLAAGLPTSVIREVLPCVEGPGPELEHCAAPTLREQLDSLDGKISALRDARSALADILATTAPDQAVPPPDADQDLTARGGSAPLAAGWLAGRPGQRASGIRS